MEAAESRFYAEYFDHEGRRCFSLMFRSGQALGGPSNGSGRLKLLSSSMFVSPAVRPERITVRLLGRPSADDANQPGIADMPGYSPITLDPGSDLDPWMQLRLGSDPQKAEAPMLDLALGEVNVDGQGNLRDFEVLNVRNPALRDWFREFISHQRFRPATVGGQGQADTALVLVRAATSLASIHDRTYLPRESTWVQAYVAALSSSTVPPVDTILLEPCKRGQLPGGGALRCFQAQVATFWSVGVEK